MIKRILILGSSGLTGTILVSLLNEYKIFTTYHSKKYHKDDIYLDILSYKSLKNSFELAVPDIVINLTGIYKNLEFCEQNKKLVMNMNCNSLKTISELANKFNSFLVTVSTDQVFDGVKGNYKECDKTCPINHYGKSKAEGEKVVQNIAKKYCIIRTSMLWGKNNSRKTFSEFILDEIKDKNELKLIQDQITSPTYLQNFCEMFYEVVKKEVFGIIHLSGPEKLSRYEFGRKLLEFSGLDKEKIIPSKRNEFIFGKYFPKDTSLNTDKAKEILDVQPEKIDISIKKYIQN